MTDLKHAMFYWLGAHVVMAWNGLDGPWEIHRTDGRRSWHVRGEGVLWQLRWRKNQWVEIGQPSPHRVADLIELTEDERQKAGQADMFISPSGSLVMTATLFPAKAKTPDARRLRALWLDDDIAKFADAVTPSLAGHGVDIMASTNDDDALATLQDESERFDVLIQDLQRPPGKCLEGLDTLDGEVTGLAFYQHCVQHVRPELPCVFVTAVAGHPGLEHAVAEMGKCCTTGKPIDLMELVASIQMLL